MMSDNRKKLLGAVSACAAMLTSMAFAGPSLAFAEQPAQPIDESPITWQSDGENYRAQRLSDGSVFVKFSRSGSGDGVSGSGSMTFWGADSAATAAPSTVSWQEGTAGETTTTTLTFDGDKGSGGSPSASITVERGNDSGLSGRTQLFAPADTLK
ncbi:hypothetical protein [Bifidobacterium sp. ESL0704]|uniref:hypothetical protein n=1 Tax=Bifidobacterium sp. ESL0704 TaxID=2983219 RepID=UPI0023F6B325|nr:hypothetical protein [Bifidobacterium sp. ESL0704]WEV53071.1 hypothetical protein OZX64_00785 [Bifidobacterium sp. ESL0704]